LFDVRAIQAPELPYLLLYKNRQITGKKQRKRFQKQLII
jgi:hypothetical protein